MKSLLRSFTAAILSIVCCYSVTSASISLQVQLNESGQPYFLFEGDPGKKYVLETTGAGPGWQPVRVIGLAPGDDTFAFADDDLFPGARQLFRVVEAGDSGDVATSSVSAVGGGSSVVRDASSGRASYFVIDGQEIFAASVSGIFDLAEGVEIRDGLTMFEIETLVGTTSTVVDPTLLIATVTDESGRVFVTYFQEDDTFAPLAQIDDAFSNSRGAAIADVNLDGYLDILTGSANGNTGYPKIYLMGPRGTVLDVWDLPTVSPVSSFIMGFAAGDMNGDGFVDFVFSGNNSNCFFYFSDGAADTFVTETRNLPPTGPGRDIDLADFDGDGDLDLVRATQGNGFLTLFFNDGAGNFTESPDLVGDAGDDPYGVSAADFDDDGDIDVIASAGGTGEILLFRNNGDNTFTGVATPIYDLNNFNAFDSFDYNQDGYLDLLFTVWSSRRVDLGTGLPGGTFAPLVTVESGLPSSSLGLGTPPPDFFKTGIVPRFGGVAFSGGSLSLDAFPDLPDSSIEWELTNGETFSGVRTISPTFSVEQPYTVRAAITDPDTGITYRFGNTIRALGNLPTAIIIIDNSGIPNNPFLKFSGSASTDDYGISSYEWDFGDGSEPELGENVEHLYESAGTYTVTLTVTDFAGQEASTTLNVTVSQRSKVVAVPWRLVGAVEIPHDTWSGNEVTIKAVAPAIPTPFQYTINFGDGSAPVTKTANNLDEAYELEAKHVYSGAEGTPFTATITVTDPSDGTVHSDTYPLIIRQRNLEVEVNVAIDEALWYLHKNQNRTTLPGYDNLPATYWREFARGGYSAGPTSAAIQAFAINGTRENGDPSRNPYVETVQMGMRWLIHQLEPTPIDLQTYGDPDSNANGQGIDVADFRFRGSIANHEPYQLGQVMDAFIAGNLPDRIAPFGRIGVEGKTYAELVQDMVDMYAWGQGDAASGNNAGGWRYNWNSQSDNSAAQWGPIGMIPAEENWGLIVPQWVKDRNLVWLNYSKRDAGGFGYTSSGSISSSWPATTPSTLVQMVFTDITTDNVELWRHAEDWIADNWNNYVSGTQMELYVLYATFKGMRLAKPNPLATFQSNGFDWYFDSTNGLARRLVDTQFDDGSWGGRRWIPDNQYATSIGTIMLSSSLFQQAPVAVAEASPNPGTVGVPVVLSGTSSFHQDPAFSIVEYRWDFDASDGIDFDDPDAIGPIVTATYPALGTYTATLQVTDNNIPVARDTAKVEVSISVPPHPPTADAGGPYVAVVGEPIELDGSGSFDIDEPDGDSITAWDWEIDFVQPTDFDDGVTGEFATLPGASSSGVKDIGLRVTDNTEVVYPTAGSPNLTDVDFTTATIYPRTVDDLECRPKRDKVQLTWTAFGDSAAIMRSTEGPNTGFVEIGRTDSQYAVYIDGTVTPGESYWYRVLTYFDGDAAPNGGSFTCFTYVAPGRGQNLPPVFESEAPTTGINGDPYLYQPVVRDPEGQTLTFVLVASPEGMEIDPASGFVQWLPDADDLGGHLVSIQATDPGGATAVQTFTILVVNLGDNTAPEITSIPRTVALTGSLYTYQIEVEDADLDAVTVRLNAAPFGMTLLPDNRTLQWVPTEDQIGSSVVSIRASDPFGAFDEQSFNVAVRASNASPVITSTPPATGRVGEAYVFQIEATDPEGDPLIFRLTTAPIGMTVSPTGLIEWTPTSGQTGTQPVSFQVEDVLGGVARRSVSIVVGDSSANQAPGFVSTPRTRAAPGFEYRYQLEAIDPDGDPVEYELILGPTGMSLNSAVGGLLTWTPEAGDIGLVPVQVIARDDNAAGSAQNFVIEVENNLPPEITSTAPDTIDVGSLYEYPIEATDPEGRVLSYEVTSGPAGMTVNGAGVVQWLVPTDGTGSYPVEVTVRDDVGATDSESFTLTVEPDSTSPFVEIRIVVDGSLLVGSEISIPEGSDVTVSVVADDNLGIQSVSLTRNGTNVPLDASNTALFADLEVGVFTLRATVTDTTGNTTIVERTLTGIDLGDVTPPVAEITSPTIQEMVSAPVDIVGSAFDPAGQFAFYTLEYALASQVDLTNLSGSDFTEIVRSSTPVTDGVLGQFDPTLVPNDEYVIRLTVWDTNGQGQTAGTIVGVFGQLKLGRLRYEVEDIRIPVAGIPITLTRVYDSFRKDEVGDFGYGWTLAVRDADIRETVPDTGDFFGATPFRVGTRVYLTTPDGERVGFTVDPQLKAVGLITTTYSFRFIPDPGVEEQLFVEDFPDGSITIAPNGEIRLALFGFAANPQVYTLVTKDGLRYTYDQRDGLQTITDQNGNQLEFKFRGVFHSSGIDVPFERDIEGRITAIIDPEGNRIDYTYDGNGDLVEADYGDLVTTYDYYDDRPHFLESINNPAAGPSRTMEYDADGRVVAIIDENGFREEQTFDLAAFTGTYTDQAGEIWIYGYDDFGRVIREEDPNGGIVDREYTDPANPYLPTRVEDANGNPTTFSYDARGNKLTETNALGHTRTWTYDAGNRVTKLALPEGVEFNFSYDAQGKLVTEEHPSGEVRTWGRDAQGRITSVTDFEGNTTTIVYNGPWAEEIVYPDGGVTELRYDNNGRIAQMSDPEGRTQTYQYDRLGNVLSIRDAAGNGLNQTFDGERLVVSENTLGERFEYGFEDDRLRTVTDPLSNVTEFEYDDFGNARLVRDQNLETTVVLYDALNRPETITDPRGMTTSYGFDPVGNLEREVDPLGRITEYEYDAADRLVSETWLAPDGTTVVNEITYDYDDLNRPTRIADNNATYSFTYDSNGLLASVDNTGTPGVPATVLTYDYDKNFNVREISDNEGVSVTFVYDGVNRQTSQSWSGGPIDSVTYEYDYNLAGELADNRRFNGVTMVSDSSYTYDALGRLSGITHREITGSVAENLTYGWDGAYRIESITRNGVTRDLTLDANGQLTGVTASDGANESYTYDANGIRTSSHLHGSGYVYGLGNELVDDGRFTYVYDAAGNRISRTDTMSGIVDSYSYDHRNRLVGFERTDGSSTLTSATYVYDALDRRIRTIVDGVETNTVYNGYNTWADFDSSGNATAYYLTGETVDHLIARWRPGDGTTWYLLDHLASVSGLLDSSGTMVGTYTYDSYGRVLSAPAADVRDRFAFTGREYDSESDTYHLRRRHYDPEAGVFLSQDPLMMLSGDFNYYRYAVNNPVMYKDPFGEVAAVEYGLLANNKAAAFAFAIVGYMHGFSVANLHFLGEFLATLDPATAIANTETKIKETLALLGEAKTVVDDVDGSGIVGTYVDAFVGGYEVVNFSVLDLLPEGPAELAGAVGEATGFEWPSASKKVGGFEAGAADGVAYLKAIFGLD